MTDYEIEQLAHRTCWRYKVSTDPNHSDTYTFNRHTLLEFARALVQESIGNWRLVPMEPTEAMLDAAFSVSPDADVAYERMLAAAPTRLPCLDEPSTKQ